MADTKKGAKPQKVGENDPRDLNGDQLLDASEKKAWAGKSASDTYAEWGYDLEVIKALGLADFFSAQFEKYKKNPNAWSESAFIRDLKKQPGFKQNSAAYQKDLEFELNFRDQWEQSVAADVEALRDQVVQMGAQVDDAKLRDLAIKQRRGGLTAAQMQNELATYLTAVGGQMRGAAGQVDRTLRQWGQRNGIALDENMIQRYVREIQAGDTTEQDVLADLRRTYMAGAYPAWADKIDAGYDIADIASPYKAAMAQLLETSEDQIDLNDPLLQRGLQGVGPDGRPSVVPLYEFQRQVRQDPRWQKTDNAYATYASAADDILSMFGFR